jgi:phospholipase C
MLNLVFTLATASSVLAVGTFRIDRIFTIIFENRNFDKTMQNSYFQELASKGRLLTNYHGVTHPSQPNYIALISGTPKGVFADLDATITDRKTIVDALEAAGKTWITYQQAYPGNCSLASKVGTYRRKHNPFISFPSITDNPARCARIVNADQLAIDIKAETVADYVFFTPDMNNDGHDTDIDYAASWLQGFLDPLLTQSIFSNTLFVITFDESEALFGMFDFTKNRIATILIGAGIPKGTKDNTRYDHYSHLAFTQKLFGLQTLGQGDSDAISFL